MSVLTKTKNRFIIKHYPLPALTLIINATTNNVHRENGVVKEIIKRNTTKTENTIIVQDVLQKIVLCTSNGLIDLCNLINKTLVKPIIVHM